MDITSAVDTIISITSDISKLYGFLNILPGEWYNVLIGILGTATGLAVIRWVWW